MLEQKQAKCTKIHAFGTHLRGDVEMLLQISSRLIIFRRRETARWKVDALEIPKNTVRRAALKSEDIRLNFEETEYRMTCYIKGSSYVLGRTHL